MKILEYHRAREAGSREIMSVTIAVWHGTDGDFEV